MTKDITFTLVNDVMVDREGLNLSPDYLNRFSFYDFVLNHPSGLIHSLHKRKSVNEIFEIIDGVRNKANNEKSVIGKNVYLRRSE
jgi:hypothetical protein